MNHIVVWKNMCNRGPINSVFLLSDTDASGSVGKVEGETELKT